MGKETIGLQIQRDNGRYSRVSSNYSVMFDTYKNKDGWEGYKKLYTVLVTSGMSCQGGSE
jgi:hypothetical protein